MRPRLHVALGLLALAGPALAEPSAPPAPLGAPPAPLGAPPAPGVAASEAAASRSAVAVPAGDAGRTLTLAQAEAAALDHQPQLLQARAQTRVSVARADEAFAPLLPQVSANATYTRTTANFVQRAGALPSNIRIASQGTSFDTFDSWNFGLTATQTIYDFGQTTGGYHAARATAEGQAHNEAAVRLSVLLNVRTTYALAWANRSLVDVARETLANSERHLEQIEGLVRAGARPDIDLAQVRADRANATLQLINAENAYATAKAQLNQAMGVEEFADYDVTSDAARAVPGEADPGERLVSEALDGRPEMKQLARQAEANDRQISSVKGGYGPSLGVSAALTEAGRDLSALTWNASAGASLTWPLFQGGITNARVREAEATRDVTRSQTAAERQQIRLEITQAKLAIRGALASLDAAHEVELNTRERLRLAEARYRAGAGSIIELEDAQVAATAAAGQVVQAEYSLSVARAQLAKGLGRT